jgi:hypothetical protein
VSHAVERERSRQIRTQMEVVVLCVAEGNEGANDVDERCVSGQQHDTHAGD